MFLLVNPLAVRADIILPIFSALFLLAKLESVAVFSTASDIFDSSEGICFSASPTTDKVGILSAVDKPIFRANILEGVIIMKIAIIKKIE